MKKKASHWKDNLVRTMEIPGDLAYSQPVITVLGSREITVENYKSIRKFTGTMIEIQTKNGILCMEGEHLTIPWYEGGEVKICGMIRHIHFYP